jgi:hypothetical protein
MPPHNKLPETILARFWKWAYARHSFEHAKIACEYLIQHNLNVESPAYHPLVVAAHIMYGRPFKMSRGGIRALDITIVPPAHRELHHQMIVNRDKVMAHSDAAEVFFQDRPANQVRLKVEHSGAVNLRVQDIKVSARYIPDIRDLCAALICAANEQIAEIGRLKEFQNLVPPVAGEYLADLTNQRFEPLSFD